MSPVVRHFVSGHAFFTGTAIIALAAAVSFLLHERKRWTQLPAVVGAVLVALSAAPIPAWLYYAWAAAGLGWAVADKYPEHLHRWSGALARACVLAVCAAAVIAEARWHITPQLAGRQNETVYVIGDSVSSGIGVEQQNWPAVFSARYGMHVVDLSRGGETVESALFGLSRVNQPDALVLLEIGGNDLLKSTPIEKFAAGLDELLRTLSGPRRRLAMLELPLPPLANRVGAMQRRLAKRHRVTLVPKRYFTNILAPDEYTVVGIHLTQKGHNAMARMFGELLGLQPQSKEETDGRVNQ